MNTIFNKNNNLLNFIHNNFWSKYFVYIIIFLVILFMSSIWVTYFLEHLINPLKFTKDTSVILDIYPEISKEKTASKVEIVEDYLKSNPNVISFNKVSSDHIQSLIKDWSSILNSLNDFSLPIIINVELKTKTNYNANDLQLALNQKVNNVFVSSEKVVASKLTSYVDISIFIMLIIPIVLFCIIFIVVLFTTVGLVYSQREAIRVLSFLGASYFVVAKEFAIWSLKRAVKGCIIGLILSLILIEFLAVILNIGFFFIPSAFSVLLMLGVITLILIEVTFITLFWVRKAISWVI